MEPNQSQNQNQFRCTGDCRNCPQQQRVYCASQHALSNMKVLDTMMGIVITMQGDINAISEKVDALQSNDTIFDPNEKVSDKVDVVDRT